MPAMHDANCWKNPKRDKQDLFAFSMMDHGAVKSERQLAEWALHEGDNTEYKRVETERQLAE
jgi:hypothetical protein